MCVYVCVYVCVFVDVCVCMCVECANCVILDERMPSILLCDILFQPIFRKDTIQKKQSDLIHIRFFLETSQGDEKKIRKDVLLLSI